MDRRPYRPSASSQPPNPVRRERVPIVVAILAAIGAAFFILPLLGLIVRSPWGDAVKSLTAPETIEALKLSIVASLSATAIALLLGVPLAWIFARVEFPGRNLLRALTTLPMVLPPVVGGIALLLAFGRRGLVGSWLDSAFGITIPFTTAAVVMAETFVAMPFLIITVEAGLRSMDRRYEDAARTLGAKRWTVFTRVTLPLIAPSLFAGAVLCWARALGEFGATITFAGNFPGVTQTMPLAVYLLLETNQEASYILSLVLLLISLLVLVALRHRWLGSA
jgi:molybdate transport system permease protein